MPYAETARHINALDIYHNCSYNMRLHDDRSLPRGLWGAALSVSIGEGNYESLVQREIFLFEMSPNDI